MHIDIEKTIVSDTIFERFMKLKNEHALLKICPFILTRTVSSSVLSSLSLSLFPHSELLLHVTTLHYFLPNTTNETRHKRPKYSTRHFICLSLIHLFCVRAMKRQHIFYKFVYFTYNEYIKKNKFFLDKHLSIFSYTANIYM